MAEPSGSKGLGIGVVAVAVAATIGVIAPVSKASADTILYDNWSGIGDNGITVNAGGESYSGYPIGPQAAQITIGAAAPYNVLGWCIDFTHNINVPGTYTDYTLVPLTPAGCNRSRSILNTPQPKRPAHLGTRRYAEPDVDQRDQLPDGSRQYAAGFGEPDRCECHRVRHPDRDLDGAVSDDLSYTGASTDVKNNVNNFLADATAYSGTQWGAEALISSNGEQQLAYGTDALPVPEPATLALLTGGLIGLGVVRHRKRSA